ncbi:hypothetical protein [Sphingobacterium sp. UBA7249]|uniref:hypothetical protein n=1 Tax=Sphingobacterium sp. UBA7249 TaxID=1947516 RepID=UPI0025F4D12A|nr:hypothetical protein [Sphingobacterium sp. UBA7249]
MENSETKQSFMLDSSSEIFKPLMISLEPFLLGLLIDYKNYILIVLNGNLRIARNY